MVTTIHSAMSSAIDDAWGDSPESCAKTSSCGDGVGESMQVESVSRALDIIEQKTEEVNERGGGTELAVAFLM